MKTIYCILLLSFSLFFGNVHALSVTSRSISPLPTPSTLSGASILPPTSRGSIVTESPTSRNTNPQTVAPKGKTPAPQTYADTSKLYTDATSKRAFIIPFTQTNLFNARAGVSIGKSYVYKEFVYCPSKDPLSGIFGKVSGSDLPSNPFGNIFGSPDSSTTSEPKTPSGGKDNSIPPQCKNNEIGYNITKSGTANTADSVRINSIYTNNNPSAQILITMIASPNVAKNPPSQFKDVFTGNNGKPQISLPHPTPAVFYRVEDGYWYVYFTQNIAYMKNDNTVAPHYDLPWIGVSIYTPPTE